MKGGMEKHIYFLTMKQNLTHDVTVFFNKGEPISSLDKKILGRVNLYEIKPQFLGVFVFYFFIIIKLIISKKKFDIIHIHGDWSSLFFISILKRMTKSSKIIYTNHGSITNSFQHSKLLPLTLRNVDLILTTGHESAMRLRKLIDKEVYVQPSGINPVFFEPKKEKSKVSTFQVVTVANLLPVKNLSLVVKIAKYMPDLQFKIIGSGSEKANLLKIIKDFKLNNIKLCDSKTAEEIKEINEISDCFLLTSLAEGTPTSVLEAMACGLPIVSSNAGGLSNIIKNNVNGFIIDDYNYLNYVEAIYKIKNNKQLSELMRKNNREISEQFKWETVAENITLLTEITYYGSPLL